MPKISLLISQLTIPYTKNLGNKRKKIIDLKAQYNNQKHIDDQQIQSWVLKYKYNRPISHTLIEKRREGTNTLH